MARPWYHLRGRYLSRCYLLNLLLLQVVLSASPKTYLTSGGPSPFGPGPISTWPTEGQCNGYGLLAAAFRRDRVPLAVSRLASPAITFLRHRNTRKSDRKLLTLLANDCDSGQDLNRTAAEEVQKRQEWIGNITYVLPDETVAALLAVNRTQPKVQEGVISPEGYQQLVGWPKQGMQFAPAPSEQTLGAISALQPDAVCERQVDELLTTNVILPGFKGKQNRTECASVNMIRSKIMVYVHNCFTDKDADMLVRVSVDFDPDKDQRVDVCQTNALWNVQVMCVSAIFMMALVAGACIVPEVLVAGYGKACRMYDKHKRAQAKKNKAKG
jgi:hypothetical protein